MKVFVVVAALVALAAASGLKPNKVIDNCLIIDDFNRGIGEQQFPEQGTDAPWQLCDVISTATVISRNPACNYNSFDVGDDPHGLYFNDGDSTMDAWAFRDDTFIGETPDKVSVWVGNIGDAEGALAYLGFWAGAGGGFGFGLNWDHQCLEIVEAHEWDIECLATTGADLDTSTWYHLEVEFLPWGQVVGNLYDEEGFVDSLSTFCGTRYGMGVALHGEGEICFDWLKRDFPGEVVKDPHFRGFDGSKYDVQGEAGKFYNILSDSNVQLNARYRAGCRKNGKSTLMSQFGLSYKFNKLTVAPEGLTMNGAALPLGERVQFGNADEFVQASDDKHLAVVIDDYVLVFAMNKVKCGGYRVDLKVENRNPAARPHGLLGQTVRRTNDNRDAEDFEDVEPVGVRNHQGEGIIHGRHNDYEVSDLFANDFKFNQFGAADYQPSSRFSRKPMKRAVEVPF